MEGRQWGLVVALAIAVTAVGASESDPARLYERAMAYARGEGVATDMEQARELLQRAAEHDHAQAQYALGWLYYKGDGLATDYSRAAKLIEESAEAGHPPAQHMLGLLYAGGEGVARDNAQALQWAQRAADNDYEPAKGLIRSLRRLGAQTRSNASSSQGSPAD